MADTQGFTIATAHGPEGVPGYPIPELPGLAATTEEGTLWKVTHVASGYAVPGERLQDRETLVRLAVEHLAVVDWTQPQDALQEAIRNTETILEAIRRFNDACRAVRRPVVRDASHGDRLWCVSQEREVLVWGPSADEARQWVESNGLQLDDQEWDAEVSPYSYLPGGWTDDSNVYRADGLRGDLTLAKALEIMGPAEVRTVAPFKPAPPFLGPVTREELELIIASLKHLCLSNSELAEARVTLLTRLEELRRRSADERGAQG